MPVKSTMMHRVAKITLATGLREWYRFASWGCLLAWPAWGLGVRPACGQQMCGQCVPPAAALLFIFALCLAGCFVFFCSFFQVILFLFCCFAFLFFYWFALIFQWAMGVVRLWTSLLKVSPSRKQSQSERTCVIVYVVSWRSLLLPLLARYVRPFFPISYLASSRVGRSGGGLGPGRLDQKPPPFDLGLAWRIHISDWVMLKEAMMIKWLAP